MTRLKLPTAPERSESMSLEDQEAYKKAFQKWEGLVLAAVKTEESRILDKVELLRFRRKSPLWEGW